MISSIARSAAVVLLVTLACHPVRADERVTKAPDGTIRTVPLPTDARFVNPWPKDWEEAFWKRSNDLLTASNVSNYGGTYFENEKSSYPNAFIDFLKGNREKALTFLQGDDADPQAQKETLSVDWYPCFTIKSQVRKYFFFGQYLTPDYRKKMFDSAKLWTAQDPLNRPNTFHKGLKEGWNVESKNSWVDVRNTDNLRAMREAAVYLMAEETGNKEVAKIYADRIRAYVTALYTTGMGEWDSSNYMSHTLTGYIQLYDFAKDPEVKLLGKAAMDWLTAAAAVKYFRGNWAGPCARDYDNLGTWNAAAGEFWMWFGQTPGHEETPYRDFVHLMTSPYRPPQAVVHLAHKNFPKPVEILGSKPTYSGWYQKPGGEEAPQYHETVYTAHSYQVGTLPHGHKGDVNGFRMATVNSADYASDIWVLASSTKGYKGMSTGTNGADQIAQYRNLILNANTKADTTFYLLCPKAATLETSGSVTFLKAEKTWVALHEIGLEHFAPNPTATDEVTLTKDKKPRLPHNQVLSAKSKGQAPVAVVVEIGEQETHGDYATFKKSVLAKSKADLSKAGEMHFTGADGAKVGLRLAAEGETPTVFRNGVEHDWKKHWALYAAGDGKNSPITLGWMEGVLNVTAGGKSFTGTLKDGKYSFAEK